MLIFMFYEFKALDKALEDWSRYQSTSTAFDDILKMILAELAPRICKERGHVSLYEDDYMEVVRRYKPDHIRNYYPPVLRELLQAFIDGVTASESGAILWVTT